MINKRCTTIKHNGLCYALFLNNLILYVDKSEKQDNQWISFYAKELMTPMNIRNC